MSLRTSASDYYERYCNWYKLTLCKIANADDQANPIHLKQLAQSALDGEPTTADEFNETHHSDVYHGVDNIQDEVNKDKCPIPGSRDYWEPKDVKIDFKDRSREKKINMISSIGYRGEE